MRPEQVDAVRAVATSLLGTSHRQAPVRQLVGRVRTGLSELFSLPEGYEVVLGNGGSTLFWDVATLGLVRERAQHLTFGEFSAKFAACTAAAPFLADPSVIASVPGTRSAPLAESGVDAYCWPHNETSTGVDGAGAPGRRRGRRRPGADRRHVRRRRHRRRRVEPATSTTSRRRSRSRPTAGLWIALMSPAAIERAEQIAAGGRWIPEGLSLTTAITNSRLDQTYNTPALATLVMLAEQVDWMLAGGGLAFAAGRSAESSAHLYGWAEQHALATPFVADPDHRSPVVGTIDLDDSVDALAVAAVLRAHGVVDTEPYRKLGRNQLRIAMFPAIDPDDVRALTACIDHVVERLTSVSIRSSAGSTAHCRTRSAYSASTSGRAAAPVRTARIIALRGVCAESTNSTTSTR